MEVSSIGELLWSLYEPIEKIKSIVKMTYHDGFEEGRNFERLRPTWNNLSEIPEEGQRILLCLDNDTIEAYTYRASNKELLQLMTKHGKAWMPAPTPPITLSKPDYNHE